ncbi:PREDICTED: uncharacterized protein LOC105570987 [Vollenhovia emeryi]|uniref:uncharacterized protein LOC105570987 n=1 Tax=Vollenhovia emeryi TaxID=411798 RepID=UPI0005F54CFE|nr:PREDICTED: uncharacterized protein LOC105570987 [Vollenhovia emeryi]
MTAILQRMAHLPSTSSASLPDTEESSSRVTTQEEIAPPMGEQDFALKSEVIQQSNSAVETQEIPSTSQGSRAVSFTTPVGPDVMETSDCEPENLVPDFKVDLLGDDNTDKTMGAPVHNLIDEKWSPIFSNGLSKESREALLKKYPVPQNLHTAKAPTLNTEIRHSKLYEFVALPFGLSTAPYIFTKILKPVAAFLRGKGFLSIIYLDDFLLLGDSVGECVSNVRVTLRLLKSLGFIVNHDKSDLAPSQFKKFLGFIFNSREMSIELPEDKRLANLQRIKKFSKMKSCKIRQFASLIGSLISICRATPYGFLYTRDFEREKFWACREYDNDFDKTMRLPSSLQPDFKWWSNTLRCSPISSPLNSPEFSFVIYTDASLTGWGASMENQSTHGWWSDEEKAEHINFLELKAVEYALKCFVSSESSKHILLRVDNTTAIAYINKMGSIQFPKLAALAKVIWQWCEVRNLHLLASYISSEDNYIADAESRVISTETEWELNASAFEEISDQFGPFDIDLFATYANSKCDSFCSWFPDPLSVAVDAFTVDWSRVYFYAFPPFAIITKTLRKIIKDKAEGETTSGLVQHFPGSREIISEAFRRKGFPERSLEVVLASLAKGTIAQYSKPIRLWWEFCIKRSLDWFHPDVTLVLEFLTDQMETITSYGTLNTYRSALALISDISLGSDERIKRFCRGVSVLKPARPKYALTWDPSPVVTYLASLWPYEDLDISIVTRKVATLLVLASAQRVQTISLIKRANIHFGDPTIVKIPDRVKTSGINRNQPYMSFPRFKDHPSLCIVTILHYYMDKTKHVLPGSSDALLLTYGKRIRAASSQTISRWVKQILFEGGIDTSVFSTHSTRHAASSSAARLGINIDEIRRSAGWSHNSTTFAKFYNRPLVPTGDIATAVILNKSL